MIAFSSVRSMVTVLVLVVLAALPSVIYSQLDFLDAVPEECKGTEDAEFDMAMGCVFENWQDCFGVTTKLTAFQDLPSAENITDCEDIELPFCDITTTCTPCHANFESLIKCIVLFDPLIDANVTELVDDVCDFTC